MYHCYDDDDNDQVDDALAHPYLKELHARADEPTCATFDFGFEKGYPDEMPQALLQKHMYAEMEAMWEEEAKAAKAATTAAAAKSAGASSAATTSSTAGKK